jgi:light-regulated signal transduction histidine kinase (bacteriophytochrome)
MYYKIIVSDNGIALNKNFQKNISIVQIRNQSKYSGTGLGLAICSRIVENHKGFIKSKPNVGQNSIILFQKGITLAK